jgi:peroxiredoxin (alkyl hydroperoxide reductase subunit C)
VDALVRMVDTLQFHEDHGEVCPAGWQKGQVGMKETAESVANYLSEHSKQL